MKKRNSIIASAIACVLIMGCFTSVSAFADSTTTEKYTEAAKLVEDIATYQAFTDEKVSKADVEAIVIAGVNAPSAMNSQSWHFSVITDADVLEEIANGMSMGMMGSGNAPEGANAPEGFTPPNGATAPEGFTPSEGMTAPDKDDATTEKPSADSKDMPTPPAVTTASGAKAGITDAPMAIVISCKEGKDLDAGLAVQSMSIEAQLLGYATKIISSPTIALNGEKQDEYKELLGIPEDMNAVCILLVGKADTEKFDIVSGATTRNEVKDIVTYID